MAIESRAPTERRAANRRAVPRDGRRISDQTTVDGAFAAAVAHLQGLVPDRRPLVLVIDDFEDGRIIMRDFLRFCGFRVETATTGKEGLEKAKTMRPDVVLLDLVLPDMDGLAIIGSLSDGEWTQHIKVVVFTASVLQEVRARVTQTGATFIAKPCDPKIIALQLADFVRDSRAWTA